MEHAHDLILLGGVLGLVSIFAGLASARIGAPLLLVFLGVGMLAGEDGPGGIQFSDVGASYLIGSIALAAILGVPWGEALVIGAALAPTDAAAVGLLLRRAATLLGFGRKEG